jgi:hypothetical protein
MPPCQLKLIKGKLVEAPPGRHTPDHPGDSFKEERGSFYITWGMLLIPRKDNRLTAWGMATGRVWHGKKSEGFEAEFLHDIEWACYASCGIYFVDSGADPTIGVTDGPATIRASKWDIKTNGDEATADISLVVDKQNRT